MKNFYVLLEVQVDAPKEQIKKNYIRLVKKYHPDIYSGDKSYAQQITAELNQAYMTLTDDEARQKYDKENYLGEYASKDSLSSYKTTFNEKVSKNRNKTREKTTDDPEEFYKELMKDSTGKKYNIENQDITSNKRVQSQIRKDKLNKERILLDLSIITLILGIFLVLFWPFN